MTTTHINLGALFFNCAATSPDRAAITFEGQTRTFSEVADRVRRLASSLADRGVAKGDRVAYIGSNHPSLIETLLATTTIGAILVPINCRLTAQEIEFIVGDAGTCAVVTDREVMPLVRTIPSTRDLLLAIVVDDGEPPETPWMSYEALIESAPSEPVEKRMSGGDDDLAVIMYTSGTTGRPKGAMLTHHNFFMHHVNALHAFDIVSNDVTLVIAPLFHIGALNVLTLSTLLKSGHLVITRRFDASETLQMIERLDVSTVFGVPAMFNFIAQDPRFEETDLSSLRFLVCGGAPVPALLIETYGQRGVPFLQAYGLTETAPLALVLDRDDVSRRLGSAGHKQMLLSDVRLVDQDTGHSVPPGTAGEVCVRGPQVMVGYSGSETMAS